MGGSEASDKSAHHHRAGRVSRLLPVLEAVLSEFGKLSVSDSGSLAPGISTSTALNS